jgi:hypothetical protein
LVVAVQQISANLRRGIRHRRFDIIKVIRRVGLGRTTSAATTVVAVIAAMDNAGRPRSIAMAAAVVGACGTPGSATSR